MLPGRSISAQKQLQQRRFGELMHTYEHIYLLMHELVPTIKKRRGDEVSRIDRGMPLYLSIEDQAPYTTTLRLTYLFEQRGEKVADPDLLVRVYHDARMGEAMACSKTPVQWINGRRHGAPSPLFERWWRNRFLEKWLAFSLRQGHHFGPQAAHGRQLTSLELA